MTHFAYPNIKRSVFVGCGRFTVSETIPGDEYELVEKLNIGNIAEIMDTVSRLSPLSSSSPLHIYFTKDKPIEVYAGDSQNLAYLLALVHCSRKIKCQNKDIWCTGSIEQSLRLKQVDMTGFEIKLKAFLSPKNNDKLFIVPAANIQVFKYLCSEADVQIILLGEKKLNRHELITQKTIIAVHATELNLLIDWLFYDMNSKKLKINVVRWAICLFCLFIFWGVYLYTSQPTVNQKMICFYNFPDSYHQQFYPALKKIPTVRKITKQPHLNKQCYSFLCTHSLSEMNNILSQQINIKQPNTYKSITKNNNQLEIYFDAGFE